MEGRAGDGTKVMSYSRFGTAGNQSDRAASLLCDSQRYGPAALTQAPASASAEAVTALYRAHALGLIRLVAPGSGTW